MSIRKGSYTRTTTASGDVLGKVESVARNELTVTTFEGTTATVSRGDSVKISHSDFKAGPILGSLEGTLRPEDQTVVDDAVALLPKVRMGILNTETGKIEFDDGGVSIDVRAPAKVESVVRPNREGVRPLPKGTGKKATALSVYSSLGTPDRKSFTEAMIVHGASASCSSTYFYNIKNRKAGWEV